MTVEFVTDPALVEYKTLVFNFKKHSLYLWWRKGLRYLVAEREA